MKKSDVTCFNYKVDADLIDDFKKIARENNDTIRFLLEAFLRTFIDNEYPLIGNKKDNRIDKKEKKECNILVNRELRDTFNFVIKQRGLNRESVISNFLSDYIAGKIELIFCKTNTGNIIKVVVR